MTPEDTKTALRNLINLTIKGDPDGETQKIVHDVLQAKMQARIAGPAEVAATPDDSAPDAGAE